MVFRSDLVPVYTFGENEAYNQPLINQSSKYYWLSRTVYKLSNIIFPVLSGRGIFPNTKGMFPNNVPIRIVSKFISIQILWYINFVLVGKPIIIEKDLNPSEVKIQEFHTRYCSELEALYNRYKNEFWYNPNRSPPKLELLENPFK